MKESEKHNKPTLFSDENCRFKEERMSEVAYSEAVTSLVIVCADILLYSKKAQSVFLAKRISKPLSNWWVIGGRISAGQLPEDGAVKNLKRETGIITDVYLQDRLEFLGMYRYFFNCRQQEPQDIACDSLSYTFALNIDFLVEKVVEGVSAFTDIDIEVDKDMINSFLKQTQLDTGEYSKEGLCQFSFDDAKKIDTHPAIKDMIEKLLLKD